MMNDRPVLEPQTALGTPAKRLGGLRAVVTAGSISVAVAAGLLATLSAGYAIPLFGDNSQGGGPAVRPNFDELSKLAVMNVDDADQIAVTGEDAESRNAAIPRSGLPLEKPGQLVLGHVAKGYDTALQCLSQAVYYEAAFEPMQGRRAVAQVVINRMRHPAYPSSICGVVYQGAERRTGCQFSFTCDGSLLRKPGGRAWNEAKEVAREALAGHVEKSVGTATHYHADYVLPKWAFGLGKIEKLGRHIFYRFKGNWGQAKFLSARYSANEFLPKLDIAALQARLDARGGELADTEFVPGLTVTPHITDRHAETDVGGRLDTTKGWRLTIPDPTRASSNYRDALGQDVQPEQPADHIALANPLKDEANP